MRKRVFISYASANKDTAERLRLALEHAQIQCWMAPDSIPAGKPYAEGILDGIEGVDAALIVMSEHANRSSFVRNEVERLFSRKLPLLPVFIENVRPAKSLEFFLSSPHWLNLFDAPIEQRLSQVIDAVRTILDEKPNTEAPLSSKRNDGASPDAGKSPGRLRLAALCMAAILVLVLVGEVLFNKQDSRRKEPVNKLLKTLYTQVPPPDGLTTGPAVCPEIQCDLFAIGPQDSSFYSLKNGDTLLTTNDDFFVGLHTLTPGYLYVFSIGASGRLTVLFGTTEASGSAFPCNPLKAGQTLAIPDANNAYLFADNVKGIERLYIAYSKTPWKALEQSLADYSAHSTPTPLPLELVCGNIGSSTRVPGGPVVQFERTHHRVNFSLPLNSVAIQGANTHLVVERWFRHD